MELSSAEETGKKKVEQAENFARPFLKKGTGLSRFYKGKAPEEIIITRKKQQRSQTQNLQSNPSHDNLPPEKTKEQSVGENKGEGRRIRNNGEEDDDELKIFEALEKAAVAGSFCSTSSLAARFLKSKLDNYVKEKENVSFKLPSSASLALGKENDESIIVPSELYSPTSSLFIDSDNEDNYEDERRVDEQEEEGNNNQQQQLRQNEIKSHNSIELVMSSLSNNNHKSNMIVSPQANHHHSHPSTMNVTSPMDKLETENTSLKARIVYLEEKMEKNTLEWWSYKEQMIDIIHGLQNGIIRKDAHLENVQSTFMNKIENLQEEIRNHSQKWYEHQMKMTGKIQELEEELEISHEKVAKVKNKMQKIIDTLQQNLHDKNVECAENHELLLNRIKILENEKKVIKDLRKPHKKAPEPITEESIRNSIQSMEDNIFGEEGEDGELGITKILPTGDKEILYSNGTRKIIAHDFSEMKHLYTNGDVRTLKRDGTVKYFYAESATWHTTYTNGVEYYEFANGQTERRNPNGIVEVVFPNGCVKYSHPSGTEECIFADNTILRVDSNGERAVVLPNGQQEIHGTDYKKRIYPDGTAKTVYNDGSQETRYPNGRIRIKDSQGILLADISHNNNKSNNHKLSPRTTSSEKSLTEKT